MADLSSFYAKRQLALDNVSWTQIIPPITCRYIVIKNLTGLDVNMRTDVANAASQDTISNGSQEIILGTPYGPRFLAGAAVAALQMASSTGTVVITYLA